jgi:hypothetical protein
MKGLLGMAQQKKQNMPVQPTKMMFQPARQPAY